MLKKCSLTLLLVALSLMGVQPLLAQETISCFGDTVTDGARIELITPAIEGAEILADIFGMDEEYHGLSFTPLVTANGNCLDVFTESANYIEIALPGDVTFPGADGVGALTSTTIASGQALDLRIGNNLSTSDPDTGHNFVILAVMPYLGEASQLRVHYGSHLSYVEVYMLSVPDLVGAQGLAPLDTAITLNGALTDDPFTMLCADVSSCSDLFPEDRAVSLNLPGAAPIGLANSDALVHLERMERPDMAGTQTLTLSASGGGAYILLVHVHCVNTCGNP